jgi:hypothetical protein
MLDIGDRNDGDNNGGDTTRGEPGWVAARARVAKRQRGREK